MESRINLGGDVKDNKLIFDGFHCVAPHQIIWAMKRMLKAAQTVWPDELNDYILVQRFETQPGDKTK